MNLRDSEPRQKVLIGLNMYRHLKSVAPQEQMRGNFELKPITHPEVKAPHRFKQLNRPWPYRSDKELKPSETERAWAK